MVGLSETLLSAIASGSVAAALVGALMQGRTARIQQEIKGQFDQLAAVASSHRAWKERAVGELLGPVNMHSDRTERAFSRWTQHSEFVEAKVIGEGNRTIRDLLLAKGHLVPPDLLSDAGRLIEHYDRWLEEFDRLRGGKDPNPDEPFVFVGVGPNPVPFPRDAADRFQSRFRDLWNELYGPAA